MPRATSRKRPKIREMRHRVTLCRASDVIDSDGQIELIREAGYSAWAKISARKAGDRGSTFGFDGQSLFERRDQMSHEIIVRARRDVDITATAWVYEAPLKSPPRWFKIIDWNDLLEDGEHWRLFCRLWARSDDVTPPRVTGVDNVLGPEVKF